MNDTPPDAFTLTPDDAAALDALLEHGGGLSVASSDGGVNRCLNLIAALPEPGVDAALDDAAVAATLARVAQADLNTDLRTLAPEDARALDQRLEAGGPRGGATSGSDDGVASLLGLLGTFDDASTEAPTEAPTEAETDPEVRDADDALVQRTLAAVAARKQRERFAAQVMQAAAAPAPRGLSASWRQIAGAAAVFVVGFSLLMPAVSRARGVAQQQACATNLATAGMQLNAWAADHKGALPRGPVGDSWIKLGQPDAVAADGRFNSNSAHLYLLIRDDYLAPEYLACASNASATTTPQVAGQMDWAVPAAVSYSYQNQYGSGPVRLDRARPGLAVLADKNPLFVPDDAGRLVFDADTARDAASRQHRGAGQNILRVDGAAGWSEDPSVGRDNVWTRSGHHGGYVGDEAPADPNRDSFLVP